MWNFIILIYACDLIYHDELGIMNEPIHMYSMLWQVVVYYVMQVLGCKTIPLMWPNARSICLTWFVCTWDLMYI